MGVVVGIGVGAGVQLRIAGQRVPSAQNVIFESMFGSVQRRQAKRAWLAHGGDGERVHGATCEDRGWWMGAAGNGRVVRRK